ncbi:DNA-binding transcriptional LysR family regulator [Palleronia aestuarii]|uniref:DNA-binding transcriptional LysR family regulator n=1 Tax=Palleronia aestuarii TaxID=568105 RepID=A0A2W7NJH2_9RHOB|nr:LysR family transcriptional regulator [Palleronia aestuarii]PZX18217.1 DNA-binding transcriptional LysR family regulator [Palleronia aestuarii]
MARIPLNDLAGFSAVARARSFTAAAAELGVSPSALSHAIRGLEERIGVRLLARSTRSVAPTEAGSVLLARLDPALAEIDAGLEELAAFRDEPEGLVRITTFHWIATGYLTSRLPDFLALHPGITVQVTVDDGFQDIVSGGFDAGLRFGEDVEKDMIAVRVGPALRHLVVATPEYWDRHGRPTHPRDLRGHSCVSYLEMSTGRISPWEFEKEGRRVRQRIEGPLICNSTDLGLALVRRGGCVSLHMEDDIAGDLASGTLEAVLEDWSPPFDGVFLYHPSRRQTPPALRALIDFLRR